MGLDKSVWQDYTTLLIHNGTWNRDKGKRERKIPTPRRLWEEGEQGRNAPHDAPTARKTLLKCTLELQNITFGCLRVPPSWEMMDPMEEENVMQCPMRCPYNGRNGAFYASPTWLSVPTGILSNVENWKQCCLRYIYVARAETGALLVDKMCCSAV